MKQYEVSCTDTGRSLTNEQFGDVWAISEIMYRQIGKYGTFIEKLADYSYVYAKSQKFDQLKAESIIRDIFKLRYGQSLNQLRMELLDREANLPIIARPEALEQAHRIKDMISKGETKPFYRAYDHAAYTLAHHLAITEKGAKELMKSAFREAEGKELYEAGKAWEQTYHIPVRKAAREAKRETVKQQRAIKHEHARS